MRRKVQFMDYQLDPRDDDFYLISIDPGLMTGMALFGVEPHRTRIISGLEVGWWPGSETPITLLDFWIASLEGRVVILYEEFVVTAGGFVPDMTAFKVIGALEHWHGTNSDMRVADELITRPPVTKGAGTKTGTRGVTDEHLKRAGIKAKSRHVNDAISHGLGWLIECSHVPSAELIYPKENHE